MRATALAQKVIEYVLTSLINVFPTFGGFEELMTFRRSTYAGMASKGVCITARRVVCLPHTAKFNPHAARARTNDAVVTCARYRCALHCSRGPIPGSQSSDYLFNDTHFHLTNYIQEGIDIHDFVKNGSQSGTRCTV
jgi:hypothetical protein